MQLPSFRAENFLNGKLHNSQKKDMHLKPARTEWKKLSFEMLENESKRHWQRIAAIAHGLIIIIDKYYH